MQTVLYYRERFEEHLNAGMKKRDPMSLYEPLYYILKLGGKRLRPALTLLSAELFGGKYQDALSAAMAVEYFHNFSLIHDDIMDAAPLRRGKITVHKKWDLNTGILSGDAMLIEAYRFLEAYPPEEFKALTTLFSKTANEVCEGQQYDIDFETRDDVTVPEYLKMIEYKTAVLVGAAVQMGAITAGASQSDQKKIYDFGINLGLAFQLQDDFLDAFGDPEKFGKQQGGDIIENKKTYLYLKSLELGDAVLGRELKDLYSIQPQKVGKKIERVKEIYMQSGASDDTRKAIAEYTEKAFTRLDLLDIPDANKEVLLDFGRDLMGRKV